ncbi:MAG TPA: TonB-dependent receptor, partial [Pedobacter sp.]
PSKYGGRLSSVLELSTREGNKKNFEGSAGIGLITSRLNIEAPIIKDRTSFILGGRTTYSNWMLKTLPKDAGLQNAKAGFYDVNLNLSHRQNAKNNIYFTGYLSNDDSNLASDVSYAYQNKNISLKWKHLFNNKLHSVVTTGVDLYDYENYSDVNKFTAYQLKFGIRQNYLKTDFTYYLDSKHTLDFGASTLKYNLQPGDYGRFSTSSLVIPKTLQAEQALESAVYIGDRFELSPTISFNVGLRYSLFNSMGPSRVKVYQPNSVKEESGISEISVFNKGDIFKTYHGPEFRLAGRFALNSDFSIKASYNTLRQYIHMLSNTASMSPTDIWKLSDVNIKPQNGDQVSLGLYKNLKSNTIETSIEGYYKRINNYLDYKSGAVLILNENIEQDVINTKGKAYGIELLIKKLTGKVNGWVSYSYSRTLLRTDDKNNDETINSGNYFPANHDKPHDFTLISNFRFSHRISMSFNATYSTGRPITLPIARFSYLNSQRVLYTDRNQYRIPNYFRSDISLNVDGNHKIKQLTHNSWTIGVYNLTARKNAFSSYFVTENGIIRGYKLSIFSTAIPFVNYNIRF